jgi:GTP-binding protein
VVGAYRTIRHELDAYGEGLEDKVELVALNKVDALSPELRAEKSAELAAVLGEAPFLVSGVSGEGVPELLRAAWAEVRRTRGEIEIEDDGTETLPPAEDWTP